jgi:hypothetical protein
MRRGTEIIIGPPGCGKTTTLSARVREHVDAGESVMICSLTRTAAAEVAGRNLPLDRDCIGTLHSHAFRALGHPTMAAEHLTDWNEHHPAYAMSGDAPTDPDDPLSEGRHESAGPGDELAAQTDLLRARMVPVEHWPDHLRSFATQYDGWKRELGVVDFTDLIDQARKYPAPGKPGILFADEAQDLSRLELELLRHWASSANGLVIVGDAWQALYEWRGSYPQMFSSDKIPADRREVLSQSYRVPRAVHAAAMRWATKLSDYSPIEYAPRAEDGRAAELAGGTWRRPHAVLALAERHLAAGRTVMIAATCSYLLAPTVALLRAEGIPYCNPWRTKRGDWNPLRAAKGTTTAQRLLAFLKPLTAEVVLDDSLDGVGCGHGNVWTCAQLAAWIELVKADGLLVRGAKAEIKKNAEGETASTYMPVSLGTMSRWFDDAAAVFLEQMYEAEVSVPDALKWLWDRMLAPKQKAAEYPISILKARGIGALSEKPRLYVGSIHSFKGAESDVVILYPDLSPQGYRDWISEEGRDSVVRMGYVGLTRARQEVHVCRPASAMHMPLAECVG